MALKKLALIGGGGFSAEVAEVAAMNDYDIVGYFALDASDVLDLPYLGHSDEIIDKSACYDSIFVSIGAVNKAGLYTRKKIIDVILENNLDSPSLISKHAIISADVSIGMGTYIAHNVCVSVGANIGDFCILNSSSIIGHHANLEFNSNISPNVFLGGDVRVSSNVIVGASANILQGIEIGSWSSVGVGSNVIRNLKANSVVWPTINKITISSDE